MRTVAKGPTFGMSATAQGHRFLSGGNGKLMAQVIEDLDRALENIRAVLAAANQDGFGHGNLLGI
jgi:hypothetical protein